VAVGTCGSPQEQGFEAARLAIQKALGLGGLSQPADVGGAAPEWPHPRRVVTAPERPSSKLVVVFVGDEDDCSSPESASGGIILTSSGNDACVVDEQRRRHEVQGYVDFLASLGRPVAGAFIVSAVNETCQDGACTPGLCCDTQCTGSANVCSLAGLCGGQGAGVRLLALEDALRRQKASDTVVGSVCNPGAAGSPGFSSILARVAEVVKQPAGLQLPTQPAAAQLTLLRIAGPDGKTRKTCTGPAPAGTSGTALDAFDWWFTGGDDTDRTPTGPSRFIFLNRTTRNCEANPGETYSADYLGLVPAAGCLTQADCQAALGGVLEDWTCDLSQGGARGTCLCGTP
ncbi:MAG: hypothetical protein NDI82_03500, partial [Anaeromyxobacteraceae bacterium]|nr:hypothetical protein [Anaeromyxobacteraceae bacterium]